MSAPPLPRTNTAHGRGSPYRTPPSSHTVTTVGGHQESKFNQERKRWDMMCYWQIHIITATANLALRQLPRSVISTSHRNQPPPLLPERHQSPQPPNPIHGPQPSDDSKVRDVPELVNDYGDYRCIYGLGSQIALQISFPATVFEPILKFQTLSISFSSLKLQTTTVQGFDLHVTKATNVSMVLMHATY